MPAYPNATIDLQVKRDGSIRDAVSGAYATITRAGSKYGLVDGRLVEYPANKLAAERYPSGKGWWAAIEEQRANSILNSQLLGTSGSSRLVPDLWIDALGSSSVVNGTVTKVASPHGDAIRVRAENIGASVIFPAIRQDVPVVAGQVVTFSSFFNNTSSFGTSGGGGCRMQLVTRASVGGATTGASQNISLPNGVTSWARATYSHTMPAGTTILECRIFLVSLDPDGWAQFDIACPQLEVGISPTSYIPTTTVAVTRPADLVTFALTGVSRGLTAETFGTLSGADWPTASTTNRFMLHSAPASGNVNVLSLYQTAATNAVSSAFGDPSGASVFGGTNADAASRFEPLAHVLRRNGTTQHRLSRQRAARAIGEASGTNMAANPTDWGGVLRIGMRLGNQQFLNGYFGRVVYLSSYASDAERDALSTALLAGVSGLNRKRNRTALGGF